MQQDKLIRARRHAEVNIAKAVETVLRRPDECATVDYLAHEAGYTRSHWSRIFSRLIGETPAVFVRRIRLEKARFLLTNADLEVSRVAAACGYNDHPAFTRAFQHVVGVTPRQYRHAKQSTTRSKGGIHWVPEWLDDAAPEAVSLGKKFPVVYRLRDPVKIAAREHFGSYSKAGERLADLVSELSKSNLSTQRRFYTVYWDSIFTHPTSEGMRSHVGFQLLPGEEVPVGFVPLTIPGGRYATVSRPVRRSERNEAWAWVSRRLQHGFAFDEHDGPPIPWEEAMTAIWKGIE